MHQPKAEVYSSTTHVTSHVHAAIIQTKTLDPAREGNPDFSMDQDERPIHPVLILGRGNVLRHANQDVRMMKGWSHPDTWNDTHPILRNIPLEFETMPPTTVIRMYITSQNLDKPTQHESFPTIRDGKDQ